MNYPFDVLIYLIYDVMYITNYDIYYPYLVIIYYSQPLTALTGTNHIINNLIEHFIHHINNQESGKVQLVLWSTVGNSLAMVMDYQLYYLDVLHMEDMVKVDNSTGTSQGLANLLYESKWYNI